MKAFTASTFHLLLSSVVVFVFVVALVISVTPMMAEVPQRSAQKGSPEYLLSLPNHYSPEELKNLAGKEVRNARENARLMRLILMAAVKRDNRFASLIENQKLREARNVELALSAYDYALNKSNDALDTVLAQLATDRMGGDVDSIVVLGVVDEWDRTIRAYQKHFYQTDGAGAHCMHYFLKMRATLYPDQYAEMHPQFRNSRLKKAYEAYLPKQGAEVEAPDG